MPMHTQGEIRQPVSGDEDMMIDASNSIVAQTVLNRHSTRAFCSQRTVPLSLLEECLALAQHTPSSTNIQPWRVVIASGKVLETLATKLQTAFKNGEPLELANLPESFHKYRSELGKHLYGPNGYQIARDDKDGQMAALVQNFRFYNAPYVAVVSIPKALNHPDLLSVGMYIQTLILLLTDRGLGTQISVAPIGYPDILKSELGIGADGEDQEILCVIGIGWENASEHINKLRMPRREWQRNVRFVNGFNTDKAE